MPNDYIINPALRRHAAEAIWIGRLLASFGELELLFCQMAAEALDALNIVMAALYRLRTTSSRIEASDAILRPLYGAAGLGNEYSTVNSMLKHCLKIRNQFSHCNWADDPGNLLAGLFFADLQESADDSLNFSHSFYHLDIPLLINQEAYFAHTLEMMRFSQHEFLVKRGKLDSHIWPMPPALSPPPLHNPPSQHIPPWLSDDDKAQHVARAQAKESGVPTPTPAQQALDKARKRKRAQRQAHREASIKAHSRDEDR